MTELKEKTQNALDESRTLILGAQILLGALYRTIFEPGYHELPPESRFLVLCTLWLITVAVGLLIAPSPYHWIVEGVQDEHELASYVLRIILFAFVHLWLSLGMSAYIILYH